MAGAATDFYELLGVPKGATEDELRTAYRKKARELHPDRNPDDPKAEDRFKEVNEAYDTLKDPREAQALRHGRARQRRGAAGFPGGFPAASRAASPGGCAGGGRRGGLRLRRPVRRRSGVNLGDLGDLFGRAAGRRGPRRAPARRRHRRARASSRSRTRSTGVEVKIPVEREVDCAHVPRLGRQARHARRKTCPHVRRPRHGRRRARDRSR